MLLVEDEDFKKEKLLLITMLVWDMKHVELNGSRGNNAI